MSMAFYADVCMACSNFYSRMYGILCFSFNFNYANKVDARMAFYANASMAYSYLIFTYL